MRALYMLKRKVPRTLRVKVKRYLEFRFQQSRSNGQLLVIKKRSKLKKHLISAWRLRQRRRWCRQLLQQRHRASLAMPMGVGGFVGGAAIAGEGCGSATPPDPWQKKKERSRHHAERKRV